MFPASARLSATSRGEETGFFLVDGHGQELELANIKELTDCAWRIRQQLMQTGIRKWTTWSYSARRKREGILAIFVVMPGKRVRPVALRNRDQRQARLPRADGKLDEGEDWDSGEHKSAAVLSGDIGGRGIRLFDSNWFRPHHCGGDAGSQTTRIRSAGALLQSSPCPNTSSSSALE